MQFKSPDISWRGFAVLWDSFVNTSHKYLHCLSICWLLVFGWYFAEHIYRVICISCDFQNKSEDQKRKKKKKMESKKQIKQKQRNMRKLWETVSMPVPLMLSWKPEYSKLMKLCTLICAVLCMSVIQMIILYSCIKEEKKEASMFYIGLY